MFSGIGGLKGIKGCDNKSSSNQGTSQSSVQTTLDIEKQVVTDTSANEQEMFDRAVAMSLESFKQETEAKAEVNHKYSIMSTLYKYDPRQINSLMLQ